jgi:hypothetical protein
VDTLLRRDLPCRPYANRATRATLEGKCVWANTANYSSSGLGQPSLRAQYRADERHCGSAGNIAYHLATDAGVFYTCLWNRR